MYGSDFYDNMTYPIYDFYTCEDEKYISNHKSILTGNPSLGTVSTFFEEKCQDVFLEVTITAQSKDGEGSTFFIKLPVAAALFTMKGEA